MTTHEKTEFRNDSGGIIGVITIEPDGKRKGIAVKPGECIWLSEDEEIATANAPLRDEDNPFINGQLVKVTDAADIRNRRPIGSSADSPEAAEQKRKAEEAAAAIQAANDAQRSEEEQRLKAGQEQAQHGAQPAVPAPAPVAKAQKPPPRQAPDETAAPPQPQGATAQGSRASGEEVATPEAVGKK
jgi:hypothetical protein